MNKKVKGLCLILACLILLGATALTAFAQGKIDLNRDVTFRIEYQDEGTPIPNAQFDMLKLADLDEVGKATLTEGFKKFKDTVTDLNRINELETEEWVPVISTLGQLIKSPEGKNIPIIRGGKTNENGEITLEAEPGVYMVIGYPATTEDFITYYAQPFAIFLPGRNKEVNEWDYEVSAAPKFEKEMFPPDVPGRLVTRKVLKIWEDEGYEFCRPESITVYLNRNGEVYETKVLTANDNWRYAWDNLDATYEWTITEKSMKRYGMTIEKNGITTIITNEYCAPAIPEDPPVYKRIKGRYPLELKFYFIMEAKDPSNPMPAGSENGKKEIMIEGEGVEEFGKITFEEPGVYEYTVKEKNMGYKNYNFDETVYTIRYEVRGEEGKFVSTRTIIENDEEAADKMMFTNKYNGGGGGGGSGGGGEIPETGALWWPAAALFALGLIVLAVGMLSKKKEN